jgi:hypothetical protein
VAAASVEILPNSQYARTRSRVGQLPVDTQLELPAQQVTRARHVARVVGFALPDVEHHEAPVACCDPPDEHTGIPYGAGGS